MCYQLNITIRNQRPGDYAHILRLTYEAFLTLDFPGRMRVDEHFLIHLMKNSSFVVPELCFVAEVENEIVGHIFYSKSQVKRPDGSLLDTLTFGPLSVAPGLQRRGVGAALVQHSLARARELGCGVVLITGVPEYYPKLGFKRAREYKLSFADGSAPDAFMAYELVPGYLEHGGIYCGWAPEIDLVERDDTGFEVFHERFAEEYFPGELMLRPFFDGDVPLMERWLRAGHVAPWYTQPDEWLREIRGRREEFAFIAHLIAEVDGKPVGFGQYYDCFDAREMEDWYSVSAANETFSIDYLVGEPEYLARGFGKAIIEKLLTALRDRGAKRVIVQPDEANEISRRALLSAGFAYHDGIFVLEL